MIRIFIIFFLYSSVLFAQNKGSITGIVTDAQTGKYLNNANIYLNNPAFGAVSNSKGKFIISNIPTGNYLIIVPQLLKL